jgi:hypothetical protein
VGMVGAASRRDCSRPSRDRDVAPTRGLLNTGHPCRSGQRDTTAHWGARRW